MIYFLESDIEHDFLRSELCLSLVHDVIDT